MEKQRAATDPEVERQEALAYCERAWPDYHEAKARRDRAAGMNADANREFSDVARAMDHCLEDLFRQTVTMDLSHDK